MGLCSAGEQLFRLPGSALDGNLCSATSENSVQQVVYDAEKAALQEEGMLEFVGRNKV